jgi:hypothetical protein
MKPVPLSSQQIACTIGSLATLFALALSSVDSIASKAVDRVRISSPEESSVADYIVRAPATSLVCRQENTCDGEEAFDILSKAEEGTHCL